MDIKFESLDHILSDMDTVCVKLTDDTVYKLNRLFSSRTVQLRKSIDTEATLRSDPSDASLNFRIIQLADDDKFYMLFGDENKAVRLKQIIKFAEKVSDITERNRYLNISIESDMLIFNGCNSCKIRRVDDGLITPTVVWQDANSNFSDRFTLLGLVPVNAIVMLLIAADIKIDDILIKRDDHNFQML